MNDRALNFLCLFQCEVCMCWQHASCFGITDRTLPKVYVCYVCENPPGKIPLYHYSDLEIRGLIGDNSMRIFDITASKHML